MYLGEWTTVSSLIMIFVIAIFGDPLSRKRRLQLFIPVLLWSLSQRVAGFLMFYLEVGEFEKRWNSFELTRLKLLRTGLQEKPVSIAKIKVGDLVFLKGDSISPADILVLDTSNTRHADKIFHVSERKVTGDNKTSTKFAIRNFHSHNIAQTAGGNNIVPQNIFSTRQSPLKESVLGQPTPSSSATAKELLGTEAKEKLIKKLVGHIEYDGPSPEAEFGGSFKIKNDPKISRITKDNVLFCGTKLYTNW